MVYVSTSCLKNENSKYTKNIFKVLEIFIKNNSDATPDFLKQILKDPDRSVRAKARRALQARGAAAFPRSQAGGSAGGKPENETRYPPPLYRPGHRGRIHGVIA